MTKLYLLLVVILALYLAVSCGCEHMQTSETKPYVLHVMGVNTPKPSEKKPYMLYIVGVGSPLPLVVVLVLYVAVSCGCEL